MAEAIYSDFNDSKVVQIGVRLGVMRTGPGYCIYRVNMF